MTGWAIKSKAERVRIAKKASRIAAAKRTAEAQARRAKAARPERGDYRRGMHPNTREAIAREVQWIVACKTLDGWMVPTEYLRITKRQAEFLATMALFDSLHWGAMGEISQALGMMRKSAWTLTKTLMKKFQVHNRHQLHAIAVEIASNNPRRRSNTRRSNRHEVAQVDLSPIGGRGRSSTQASMFANPVSGRSVSAISTDAAPRTEALHPGTAPSRVL